QMLEISQFFPRPFFILLFLVRLLFLFRELPVREYLHQLRREGDLADERSYGLHAVVTQGRGNVRDGVLLPVAAVLQKVQRFVVLGGMPEVIIDHGAENPRYQVAYRVEFEASRAVGYPGR